FCYNFLTFDIQPNGGQWTEYEVPFSALHGSYWYSDSTGDLIRGPTWDRSQLLTVEFRSYSVDFDLWVDDVGFYSCPTAGCLPTCTGSTPVACPASGDDPAGCWPTGTVCATVPRMMGALGVWAGASDAAWIGGAFSSLSGTLRRWDGLTWAPADSATTAPINAVWASGSLDVWTVGDRGTIRRWDGAAWAPASSNTNMS